MPSGFLRVAYPALVPSFADHLADPSILLLFGLTPPRTSVEPQKATEIGQAALRRLDGIPVDALALYDLDDESDRTEQERPFPFLRTMDPSEFLADHLSGWQGSSVVYRSVGKYAPDEFTGWLDAQPSGSPVVFVGASSSDKEVRTTLRQAQELRRGRRPDLPLGAVAIPERHTARGDEHERLLAKQEAGCSFFITQVVYDLNAAKSMASDYVYACREKGIEPARIIFTLSLCGSIRTLEFLEWLGVDVPRWVRNDLTHVADPLGLSVVHALDTARDLRDFCRHLGLPCGFNVESVSNRRVEIDAAVHVLRQLAFEMHS